LALIVLWSTNDLERTTASVPASVLSFVIAIVLAPLSWLEHTKSIRPSPLICAYLFFSTLLDLAQIRTLWIGNFENSIASVFSTAFAIKAVLFALESTHKTKLFIDKEDAERSPEDRSGFISRGFFLWMNRLILIGYVTPLNGDKLYPTPIDAAPETLEAKLVVAWADCEYRMASNSYRTNLLNSSTNPKTSLVDGDGACTQTTAAGRYSPTTVHDCFCYLPTALTATIGAFSK
jgi:ATP-binding cassette subfamily C (CFTR/MRP) protein 1